MTHDAEGRVRAYLAAYEDECSLRRNVPAHGLLSAMSTTNHGQLGLAARDLYELLQTLAEVIAEHADLSQQLAEAWHRDRRQQADNQALRDHVTELEAERARYIDTEVYWAVRLSGGTHIEFQTDEGAARTRAKTYRATLLSCDVLSTDWREAGQHHEDGE